MHTERTGRRRPGPVLFTVGLIASGCARPPAAAPIQIDGDLADWADVPVVWRTADSAAEQGLSSLRIADDPVALYLGVGLTTPANVQGLDGAMLVVLDADADPRTGVEAFGLPGAELVVSFTRLSGADGALAVRHGVQAWVPVEGGGAVPSGDVLSPYDLGLAFEPRHTAREIEIRVPKTGGSAELALAARAVRLRVVTVDAAGRELSATRAVTHRLASARARPPRRAQALERAAHTDFRLLSWNISRGNLMARSVEIARILSALDPDIILLDEVPPEATEASVRAVLPRASEGPGWAVHLGTSGSRQRGVVAVRGGVSPAARLARVAMPDSVRHWLEAPATADLEEVRENLDRAGVPATGAWVELAGARPFLAVTLDLVCCGNSPSSPEDRIRRIEAASIRAAIGRQLADIAPDRSGSPPVIVAGDFNLVGRPTPLAIAARGLDEGEDLVPVEALQLDGISSATWDGGSGPFPPGQLDYVLYPSSRLESIRAFSFESRDLTGAELEVRGLEREDSDRASDHRPVVVDFAWRPPDGGGGTVP